MEWNRPMEFKRQDLEILTGCMWITCWGKFYVASFLS